MARHSDALVKANSVSCCFLLQIYPLSIPHSVISSLKKQKCFRLDPAAQVTVKTVLFELACYQSCNPAPCHSWTVFVLWPVLLLSFCCMLWELGSRVAFEGIGLNSSRRLYLFAKQFCNRWSHVCDARAQTKETEHDWDSVGLAYGAAF